VLSFSLNEENMAYTGYPSVCYLFSYSYTVGVQYKYSGEEGSAFTHMKILSLALAKLLKLSNDHSVFRCWVWWSVGGCLKVPG
jgi:hypothetical protein